LIYVDPYFDPKVTFGSVLVAGSMLVAACTSAATGIIAWRDLNWRIKNAEKWQEDHEEACKQNDAIIARLESLVTETKSLVASSDRRIEMGERRMDRIEGALLRIPSGK
jgi:hypothetical protein